MTTCALFVDYENVVRSLKGQGLTPTHKQLADLFRAEVDRYGELVYARAYAPWDLYPEAMAIFDRHDIRPDYVEGGRKDNADLVMSLAIQEFLRIPGRDADLFILVTGDGDFLHVIRILQQERKRVVVWGVEGSISARLAARVGEVFGIQRLLVQHGVVSEAAGEAGPSPQDAATRALILRAESVMLERGWVQLPFLTLLRSMSSSRTFGEESEQRRMLILRAMEQGIFETKKQPNPKRPGTETTFVLLRKESPVVAETLRAASRVVHWMRELLSDMPRARWVAYSLLDRALGDDPLVPKGSAAESERRQWIDLCIAEGLLRLERKENPRKPEHPTAALYLMEEHPLVAQHIPGDERTPSVRRLILCLDHYLTRTGYRWMSMGLLRRNLLGQEGQQEMERSIRLACEAGIVLVRQQPNQFGVRPTTGAYLQMEHPTVVETLAMRDRLLDALLQLFREQDVVELELVAAHVGQLEEARTLPAQEWIGLLVEQQILSHVRSPYGEPALLLNRQHPVVARRSSLVS